MAEHVIILLRLNSGFDQLILLHPTRTSGKLQAIRGCRPSQLQMSSVLSALSAIAADPAYHDYLAILKGARNGIVYGVKVRFPHALIMAILFGRGR